MPLLPALTGLSGVSPRAADFSWGDYPGMVFRCDISDKLHITMVGTAVTQVNDVTGNGRHLVQANASLQPTTVEI